MMKYLWSVLFILVGAFSVRAENVILMIGDGMGANHIACAQRDKELFIPTLPVKGSVRTRSADKAITDSAASATAYACGQKTNNGFLGLLPDGSPCRTLAEEAAARGYGVGIRSTDYATGATPSAFYTHVRSRNDKEEILRQKEEAARQMDIQVPVQTLAESVGPLLEKLGEAGQPFFVMLEGAKIDTHSHQNDLAKTKEALFDFDAAVVLAAEFAQQQGDTTVIVLADHETGGLTDACEYTTKQHTAADIPVHARGPSAALFEGNYDNTEVYQKIYSVLFAED